MSDLYVLVNILPNLFTNAGLTVDAWLASSFVRNPSGQQLPLNASPAATTTTSGSGAATLTGLVGAGAPYWVRVIDSLGYFHWYYANWETGDSSGSPLMLNANVIAEISWPL
jgi:hypothetical protein